MSGAVGVGFASASCPHLFGAEPVCPRWAYAAGRGPASGRRLTHGKRHRLHARLRWGRLLHARSRRRGPRRRSRTDGRRGRPRSPGRMPGRPVRTGAGTGVALARAHRGRWRRRRSGARRRAAGVLWSAGAVGAQWRELGITGCRCGRRWWQRIGEVGGLAACWLDTLARCRGRTGRRPRPDGPRPARDPAVLDAVGLLVDAVVVVVGTQVPQLAAASAVVSGARDCSAIVERPAGRGTPSHSCP